MNCLPRKEQNVCFSAWMPVFPIWRPTTQLVRRRLKCFDFE